MLIDSLKEVQKQQPLLKSNVPRRFSFYSNGIVAKAAILDGATEGRGTGEKVFFLYTSKARVRTNENQVTAAISIAMDNLKP